MDQKGLKIKSGLPFDLFEIVYQHLNFPKSEQNLLYFMKFKVFKKYIVIFSVLRIFLITYIQIWPFYYY